MRHCTEFQALTGSQIQLGFRYRSPQGGVMKRNVIGALMTLIVAFSIAVPAVQAQQTIMSANVPFAFNIGDKQLPAGSYAVREMDRATLIQSSDGATSVLGIYAYAGPSKADETKLVFNKVGDHYFLAQIW